MKQPFDDYPREDSKDLTEEEITTATAVNSFEEWRDALIHLSCSTCGEPVSRSLTVLRRRKPDLFSRENFVCKAGHTMTRLFRISWIEKDGQQ